MQQQGQGFDQKENLSVKEKFLKEFINLKTTFNF